MYQEQKIPTSSLPQAVFSVCLAQAVSLSLPVSLARSNPLNASKTSNLVHNNPNRRQHVSALARPTHAGEGTAGALASVLDCGALLEKTKLESALFATRKGRCSKRQTYLRPGPVPLLHHLSDGPLAGVGALEHVINHHFRGEGCGDVEDLEVAVAEFPSSQFCWVLPLKQDVPIWETPEREGGREEKEEEENNNKNSQRLPGMLVLPNLGRLVEDVQLGVLGREHVVHAWAQSGGFVDVLFRLLD